MFDHTSDFILLAAQPSRNSLPVAIIHKTFLFTGTVNLQMPLHYLHLGEVRSEDSDRCLDTMSRKAGQKVNHQCSQDVTDNIDNQCPHF